MVLFEYKGEERLGKIQSVTIDPKSGKLAYKIRTREENGKMKEWSNVSSEFLVKVKKPNTAVEEKKVRQKKWMEIFCGFHLNIVMTGHSF